MATIYRWISAFFVSLLIFTLFFLYTLYAGNQPTTRMINGVAANTALTVVILSFAIGNIAFFFPLLSKFIKYRKETGLTGFFIILIHITLTLLFLQNVFPFPSSFIYGKSLISFIAALLATGIVTLMALISNATAIKMLGKWWRRVLRMGYIAVSLGLLHMTLRETGSWGDYVQNLVQPPPLSIIILWFGVWTILLRICVAILTRHHKATIITPDSPTLQKTIAPS